MQPTSTNHTGFTLVEIVIVIGVTSILIGMLFGPLTDLYTSNTNSIKSTTQTSDMRGALRAIERDVTLAKKFLSTDEVDDPRGPNNNGDTTKWNWQGIGSNNANARVLIAGTFATTSTNNLRYANTGSGCTEAIVNNLVYFIRNNNLYRRTIVNRTTPCDGTVVAQKQSCAPSVSHSSCEAIDAKLAGDVRRFSTTYYSSSGSPLSSPTGARSVAVTLSIDNPADTVPASTGSLRIALINEEMTP